MILEIEDVGVIWTLKLNERLLLSISLAVIIKGTMRMWSLI